MQDVLLVTVYFEFRTGTVIPFSCRVAEISDKIMLMCFLGQFLLI